MFGRVRRTEARRESHADTTPATHQGSPEPVTPSSPSVLQAHTNQPMARYGPGAEAVVVVPAGGAAVAGFSVAPAALAAAVAAAAALAWAICSNRAR